MQQQAAAKAVLSIDGTLTVSSATADIGTGTYTGVRDRDQVGGGLYVNPVFFLF